MKIKILLALIFISCIQTEKKKIFASQNLQDAIFKEIEINKLSNKNQYVYIFQNYDTLAINFSERINSHKFQIESKKLGAFFMDSKTIILTNPKNTCKSIYSNDLNLNRDFSLDVTHNNQHLSSSPANGQLYLIKTIIV